MQTIDVLVGLLELDDRYFSGNSHLAAGLARAVAERLLDSPRAIDEVYLGALLRDVGRFGLPDPVRDASGSLDADQARAMQSHVDASVRLVEHIEFPWKVLPVIRHHHERYDGSGYPDGLRGREIPYGARVLAVVDAYVAMTSPRSHREARTPDEALDELMRQAGHQFDPEVVETLQTVLAERLQLTQDAGKPAVLVIDDDPSFTRLFRHQLTRDGFDVSVCKNSEEGMRQILESAPRAVVCRVETQSEAAFALLAELRESEATARIPVLFMMQRTDRQLRLRAFQRGVDDLFLRDDNLEELSARVRNVTVREAIRQDGRVSSRKGVSGTLENLSLPDIVQTLVVGMKTACVSLSRGTRKGKISFEQGRLVAAECGKRKGENAFYELVTWQDGEFVIEHGIPCKRPNLEGDAMFLLMEGLRRMDEAAEKAAV